MITHTPIRLSSQTDGQVETFSSYLSLNLIGQSPGGLWSVSQSEPSLHDLLGTVDGLNLTTDACKVLKWL